MNTLRFSDPSSSQSLLYSNPVSVTASEGGGRSADLWASHTHHADKKGGQRKVKSLLFARGVWCPITWLQGDKENNPLSRLLARYLAL